MSKPSAVKPTAEAEINRPRINLSIPSGQLEREFPRQKTKKEKKK
jgi:hypothetical protein